MNLRIVFRIALFCMLTLLTEVGGIALLALYWAAKKISVLSQDNERLRSRYAWSWGFFVSSYLLLTCLVVPLLAPVLSDRRALPCLESELPINAAHIGYCVLNRHYVAEDVYDQVLVLARKVKKRTGTSLQYLDAGFPFLRGVPLLPHLSHSDGRKIDFAFIYKEKATGQPTSRLRSPIGYWGYVQQGEYAQEPSAWLDLRWDFDWLQPILAWRSIAFDRKRTRIMIRIIARDPSTRRIFLETPLKRHLQLASKKIGYQGKKAARHDDHFHVSFK